MCNSLGGTRFSEPRAVPSSQVPTLGASAGTATFLLYSIHLGVDDDALAATSIELLLVLLVGRAENKPVCLDAHPLHKKQEEPILKGTK